MGRPPIGKPLPLRLPAETLADIKARVGTYGVSKFIREAIAEKLDREK